MGNNNSKNEEEKTEGIDSRLQIVLKVDDKKQSDEQKKFINSEGSTSYFFNGKQQGLILPSQQSLSLMIEQIKGEMVSLQEEIVAKEKSWEEVSKRVQKEESLNMFLDQYLPHPSLTLLGKSNDVIVGDILQTNRRKTVIKKPFNQIEEV